MKTRLTLPLVLSLLLLLLITGCTAISIQTPIASTPETAATGNEATSALTETIEPAAASTESMPEPTTSATEAAVQPTQQVTETTSGGALSASGVSTTTTSAVTTIDSGAGITPSTESTATTSAGMANPASQYCVAQGGKLTIEERGDSGQFGVCTFEDNRQCEEWAMMRGECPVGGIKVTGFLTPAARFCAITGGDYTGNGSTSAANEQGVCTFTDGKACSAADYYNGMCTP